MTVSISYTVSTDRQGASGLGQDAQRQAVARHIGEHGQKMAVLSEIESRGGVLYRGDLIAAASFLTACTGASSLPCRPTRAAQVARPSCQQASSRPDGAQDDMLVVTLFPTTHRLYLRRVWGGSALGSNGQRQKRAQPLVIVGGAKYFYA